MLQLTGIYFAFEQMEWKNNSVCFIHWPRLNIFLLGYGQKKPYDAIITGIIVYSILIIGNATFDPLKFYRLYFQNSNITAYHCFK
jgi:hypothetical protein